MKKRIWSLLLAVSLLLPGIPVLTIQAVAQTGEIKIPAFATIKPEANSAVINPFSAKITNSSGLLLYFDGCPDEGSMTLNLCNKDNGTAANITLYSVPVTPEISQALASLPQAFGASAPSPAFWTSIFNNTASFPSKAVAVPNAARMFAVNVSEFSGSAAYLFVLKRNSSANSPTIYGYPSTVYQAEAPYVSFSCEIDNEPPPSGAIKEEIADATSISYRPDQQEPKVRFHSPNQTLGNNRQYSYFQADLGPYATFLPYVKKVYLDFAVITAGVTAFEVRSHPWIEDKDDPNVDFSQNPGRFLGLYDPVGANRWVNADITSYAKERLGLDGKISIAVKDWKGVQHTAAVLAGSTSTQPAYRPVFRLLIDMGELAVDAVNRAQSMEALQAAVETHASIFRLNLSGKYGFLDDTEKELFYQMLSSGSYRDADEISAQIDAFLANIRMGHFGIAGILQDTFDLSHCFVKIANVSAYNGGNPALIVCGYIGGALASISFTQTNGLTALSEGEAVELAVKDAIGANCDTVKVLLWSNSENTLPLARNYTIHREDINKKSIVAAGSSGSIAFSSPNSEFINTAIAPGTASDEAANNPRYAVFKFDFYNHTRPSSVRKAEVFFKAASDGRFAMHGMGTDWGDRVTWNGIRHNLFTEKDLWSGPVNRDGWARIDVTGYLTQRFEAGDASAAFALTGTAPVYSHISDHPMYMVVEYQSGSEQYLPDAAFLQNSVIFYENYSVSYIDGVCRYIGGDDKFVYPKNDGTGLKIPDGYIQKYFPGLDLSGNCADELAQALGYGIVSLDGGAVVLTANPEALENAGSEVKEQIANAKYGKFRTPPQNIPGAFVNTGRSDFYEAQTNRFAQKDSDESLAALAEDFFPALKLEAMPEIRRAYEAGNYREAFRRFNKRFIDGIKRLDIDERWALTSRSQADSLYHGYKRLSYYAEGGNAELFENVYIGEPGEVNWTYRVNFYENPLTTNPNCDMIQPVTYHSLLDEAAKTGNAAYARKWFLYMDDLSLSVYDLPYKNALDCGYNGTTFFGSTNLVSLTLSLQKAAQTAFTQDASVIPDGSLARFLKMLMDYYIPDNIVRTSVHPQNWGITVGGTYITIAGILKDFKYSDMLRDIARQRAESYLTQMDYIDGGEMQKTYGYDKMMPNEYAEVNMPAFRRYDSGYYQANSGFYEDALWDRAAFFVRKFTNAGDQWCNGQNTFTTNRIKAETTPLAKNVPRLLDDPITSAIMAKPNGGAVTPAVLSDSFPYSGYYIMRDGWELDSQYGELIAHNKDWVINEGANHFSLYAYGMPLLVTDLTGTYANESISPLLVDGHRANTVAASPSVGHQRLSRIHDEAQPLRNYTSASFDFAEGEYGGYFMPRVFTVAGQRQAMAANPPDATHKRAVSFLKELGLWVVTDRVSADNSHSYTLRWDVLVRGEGEPAGANKIDGITITGDSVSSNTPGKANLSMYNYSNLPFAMTKSGPTLRKNRHYGEDYTIDTVRKSFATADDTAHISVIYPRESVADVLDSIQKVSGENYVGFEAEKQGTEIGYAAAVSGGAQISLNDFVFDGEALLYQIKQDGSGKGMALGCVSLSYGGARLDTDTVNFEFVIDAQGVVSVTNEIYTPLNVPEVSPKVPAFSDMLTVTMSHELGDKVDIIYTLDESAPTLESPQTMVYTGPFTIDSDTNIKARAVRKGTDVTPLDLSATLMSYEARAYYKKNDVKPASGVFAPLEYKYYETNPNQWGKLFLHTENAIAPMESLAEGSGDLFDLTAADFSKPYAFDWTGSFYAEEAGDYTFIFPEELWRIDINAGYNLCLYLDGENIRPSQRKHSMGKAVVSLEAGNHKFELRFTDYRTDAQTVKIPERELVTLAFDRDNPAPNFGSYLINQYVWNGKQPEILVSCNGGGQKALSFFVKDR